MLVCPHLNTKDANVQREEYAFKREESHKQIQNYNSYCQGKEKCSLKEAEELATVKGGKQEDMIWKLRGKIFKKEEISIFPSLLKLKMQNGTWKK